jgi:hypothetical protein
VSDATVSLADLKAQRAAAEKALAAPRATMLRAVLAKVQAANLAEIAADLTGVLDAATSDKDLMVFKLHADVIGSTEQMLTDAIAAADKIAAA